MLPHLLSAAKKELKNDKETLILCATSGDTGKAALEAFKDREGFSVIVYYPLNGVSEMQKLSMTTQEGENVAVFAIKGNFDDAQKALKENFNDKDLTAQALSSGVELSSANSINFGRIAPQVVYYISAYCDLVGAEEIKSGDKINFCVPSGNFGNILAGYYAKKMGVPINKLICASNKNNILTDFFFSGEYDTKRDFFYTMSPSMDIVISSNLERLLFEVSGQDDDLVKKLCEKLKNEGIFEISSKMLSVLSQDFAAGFSDEYETETTIANFYESYDYALDTHTAVAASVYDAYLSTTGDETYTVLVSTASPYKFPKQVLKAISKSDVKDEFKAIKKLQFLTGVEIPENIASLEKKEQIHKNTIEKGQIRDTICKML
jgi:threonine synthase